MFYLLCNCSLLFTEALDIIKNDSLLRNYGVHLIERIGGSKHLSVTKLSSIQDRLSALAEMMQSFTDLDNKTLTLGELIQPKYFSQFINFFSNAPSNKRMMTLSKDVKYVAILKSGEAIASECSDEIIEANEFLNLHFFSWVSRLEKLKAKDYKGKRLKTFFEVSRPVYIDTQTFSQFLERDIPTLTSEVPLNLEKLKKEVLSALILVNNKKLPAVQHMTVEEYKTGKDDDSRSAEDEMVLKAAAGQHSERYGLTNIGRIVKQGGFSI